MHPSILRLSIYPRQRQLYPTVGYMDSGIGYPWYGMTVGENSRFFPDFRRITGKPCHEDGVEKGGGKFLAACTSAQLLFMPAGLSASMC